MSRAGNLLRRAWHLLGRLGPFPVTARPVAVPGDDYRLHTMTWGEPTHDAVDGEVLLGEVPLHMNTSTKGKR